MRILQQNQLLPAGAETQPGQALHLPEVARQHAGLYTCTADNGLGTTAAASIQIDVLCKTFYTNTLITALLLLYHVPDPPELDLILDWVKHHNQKSAQVTCSAKYL